jgi:predicted ArsR family transcriptional regulator
MDTPALEQVATPAKKQRKKPGVGATAKSRSHKTKILDFLREPPQDFDGTNGKIAQHLGLSAKQAQRLLHQLWGEGKIKLEYVQNAMPGVNGPQCRTTRFIQLVKENT